MNEADMAAIRTIVRAEQEIKALTERIATLQKLVQDNSTALARLEQRLAGVVSEQAATLAQLKGQ